MPPHTTPTPERLDVLREIPPLMPQFLMRRRVGLPLVGELVQELGVERPILFTLLHLRLVQGSYGDKPVSFAELRAYNPYHVVDNLTPHIAVPKEEGLVVEDEEGGLRLSERGWEVVERLHAGGRDYVGRLQPLPPEELEELARQLERAVDAVAADPVLMPRPGSHLAGSGSLSVARDAPAMVQIEQAIYELWGARDDAHMKAWRDAGMEGPAMAVLTRLWYGEASTVGELAEALKLQQTPEDVESSLTFLVEKEYIERDGDEVQLTPKGVLAREDIEHETDRIYFAPWPHTAEEAAWIRDRLRELIANLPTPPPPA